MKRIGVIVPAIVDNLQSELLDGIFRTASDAGFDVIVLTTASSGLEFHIQNEIMEGEESIYALIESAKLDGILLASQYFVKESVRLMISEKIRKVRIPCIDLGGTALGFETVAIPQDKAVYDLTKHIIVQHGCRHLLFLAGHEENRDSEQRMQGFLEAVKAHGCTQEIVYGDFWKVRAQALGEELLHHKRPMPDAVICASDVMAVTLCQTLQAGGISIPDEVIVTGFDGHISAMSSFPSITTIGGAMADLGSIGAAKLIGMLGGCPSPVLPNMHILYGASCGCVERMTDYHAAALQVQAQIRRDAETAEMLEMRINADLITRTACVESLAELTDVVDQTAHILKGYRSLQLCILPDWDGDPEHPDECRTKPFPKHMHCAISKQAWTTGTTPGLFPTAQLVPMLAEPHEPVLVFVLPVHAAAQVFGYCAFAYEKAADFSISVMLFHFLSAVASGLRMLRHKLYADFLQRQIEEASLYDKMTDMLSKKGLLLHLEQQIDPNGILLVTIARLAAVGTKRSRMTDSVIQSELLLANAIRLLSGQKLQAARLDKQTFAVVFPAADDAATERIAEELMIQLEVLLRKMQEGSAAAFLPEPYYVCGLCEAPFEECLAAMREQLVGSQPKESGFIGIAELRRLRRELRKAPELDWSLEELAKRLNISKSYVQKLYKTHFGISYMDDLIDARISMAKQLLQTTDLQVTEIAEICGYHNDVHFMRQFKNKTGLSPSEYRKKQ